MKTKVLTYEELIEKVEIAFREGRKFDLGDGMRGKIAEIKYYQNATGINSIIFKLDKNEAYYKEKAKLKDDFDIEIYDWTNLFLQKGEKK